ncbi:hypothetical protein DM794_19000 [Paenarthrobacter ureafaciens]|nr:hypothetical protein [Paenarthrobacter ureafaciens]
MNLVKFYGPADLASAWHFDRLNEVIAKFRAGTAPLTAVDAIELYNVYLYIDADLLPATYSPEEHAAVRDLRPSLIAAFSRFFSQIDDSNVISHVSDVGFLYSAELVELLGRNKAYDRCDPELMIKALTLAGVNLATMLGNKKLVTSYEGHVREALLADPKNAEHLVRKYLLKDASSDVHLPKSFSVSDSRDLLSGYLDSAGANLNYVRLIETAPVEPQNGIDAKIKLKAKRRAALMVEELFNQESALKIKTGTEVRLSDSQQEPVQVQLDEMVTTFTYSRRWLDETLDMASILNNFQHLFEFADNHALLTLPSYTSELGVFERLINSSGRRDYLTGAAYNAKEASSLIQTRLYQDYLASKNIGLEEVISWFFADYLRVEFKAENFSFAPSAAGSSYLEKARHLFAEMEGVVNQFKLFVQDGEVDRELLALTSDPVAYREVPSLLEGKYVYATEHNEIAGVLHTLFSDQSGLTYIKEALHDSSAARLLLLNKISYADFAAHQQRTVDELIRLGVLENTGTRVQFVGQQHVEVLYKLHDTQGAAYHRLTRQGRDYVDSIESRGWVSRESSLLTESEASYFNYLLNKTEFSNGPELRNKYLHGSQPPSASEAEHFHTYLTALKLLMSLVIKINDEFCLFYEEEGRS